MFTLRIINIASVRRGHARFLEQNDEAIAAAAEVAGQHSIEHVARYPRFKPRTGTLQRGQRFQVLRLKGGRLLRLYNEVTYANPIDKGSVAHVIRARRAPALHFYWARMGRWFTGPKVNHPGNKPYKFGYRAWRSAYRVEGQELSHRLTALAAKF
jgi:hypothetical protein